MVYKTFCKIIKETRLEKKITQKEMALKLGISQGHYCKIECGEQEPNFLTLTKIIKYLNIDFNEILKNDVESKLNSYD